MDLYKLIGRIVVASLITGIIVVPLIFLLISLIEKWPLLIVVLLLIGIITYVKSSKGK